ncbi:MAG TPA: CHAD domain-containing protein [Thermoanaerobaculia bacterium]|nr:CHAD domain-containing protein [Thermoanaerobaculia bacterium]HUM30080.1 CHAD domain-containing protein [Thermoanaerobaculia bacterium]HXK69424.1 CHAD domain-containing protein [Thermoanaerobaculia bacterium]
MISGKQETGPFTRKEIPPHLQPGPQDSLVTGISAILVSQGWLMEANLPGTMEQSDPEYLHQMRVATRRLRFTLRLFQRILITRERARMVDSLRWIASLLGDVRDDDVLIMELSRWMEDIDIPEDSQNLVFREIVRDRDRHILPLKTALTSPRLRALLKKLVSIRPESSLFRRSGLAAAPLIDAAPLFILKKSKRVRRWLDRTPDSFSPDELHRLRIDFKGLRYTCEFFSSFYPKSFSKHISRFVAYQDCLGAHQDARVAGNRIRSIAERLSSGDENAIEATLHLGRLLRHLEQVAQNQRKMFAEMWPSFPKQFSRFRSLVKRF